MLPLQEQYNFNKYQFSAGVIVIQTEFINILPK